MAWNASRTVVDFLEDQAGEYLRGAIHYSENDYDVLYLRDDVKSRYGDGLLEEEVSYWRQKSANQGEYPYALGNRHCTTHFFDDAILFHFAQSDEVGTVITFDPDIGRNLVHFITDCLKELYFNSPQEIENAPTWLQDE